MWGLRDSHPLAFSAVAGDECIVRVIDLAEPTAAYDVSISRSAKALEFDPLGRFLAVSTIDGGAAVLDLLESRATHPARQFDHVKIADNDDPDTSSVEFPLAWHPSGAVLALGTNQGVTIIARETWAQVYALQVTRRRVGEAAGGARHLRRAPAPRAEPVGAPLTSRGQVCRQHCPRVVAQRPLPRGHRQPPRRDCE